MSRHGSNEQSQSQNQHVPRHGEEGYRDKAPVREVLDRVAREEGQRIVTGLGEVNSG